MKHLVICFFLLISTISYSQVDTCFTQEQIINTLQKIQKLQIDDSLKTNLIKEYENEIKYHENLHKQDSLLISYQNQEIELLQRSVNLHLKLYKSSKIRWYDSKVIWMIAGASMILTSSYIVKNVK